MVVYGNDDGLIAERAVTLAKTVCEDLKDPFRVVDISGDMLKDDPARLADEFGAMSMLGGRRVIRVRPAGEESAAALENLAAASAGDALVVIEGGNLTPRSSLRTHCRDRGLPGRLALLHGQRGRPRRPGRECGARPRARRRSRCARLDRRAAGRRSRPEPQRGRQAPALQGRRRQQDHCARRRPRRAGRHRRHRHRQRHRRHLRRRAGGPRPRARPRVRRRRQSGAAGARPAAPCRPAPSRGRPCRQWRQPGSRDVQGARPAARRAGAPALRAPSCAPGRCRGSARRCTRCSRRRSNARAPACPTKRLPAGSVSGWPRPRPIDRRRQRR